MHSGKLTPRQYWRRYLLIQLLFTAIFAPTSIYLDVRRGLDLRLAIAFYLVESVWLALWMA